MPAEADTGDALVDPGDILVRHVDEFTRFRRGTLIGVALPDAALIAIEEPVAAKPVGFIANVRAEHERAIEEERPLAIGFSDSYPEIPVESRISKVLSSLGVAETGQLLNVQVEGGQMPGMSGSPVLLEVFGNWACLGMLYWGGERAGNSRMMLGDPLLGLIARHSAGGTRCLDADDVLGSFREGENVRLAQLGKDHAERFIAYATSAGRVRATEQPISLESVYVHRSRQEERIRELRATHAASGNGMWVSIEGQGGAGKTSLLWHVYRDIGADSETFVQPFAAQYMSDDCVEEKALIAHYRARKILRGVVLIDTLDLIAGRSDRQLVSFLSWLKLQRVLVVTTCRPIEAGRLAAMEHPDHRVPLGRYEQQEAKIAVRKYVDLAYADVSEEQRDRQRDDLWNLLDGRRKVQALSFDPLVLRMIFEAYPPEPVPVEVNTALIYSAYWERRVVRDRLKQSDAQSERLREAVACRLAYAILFRETDAFDDAIREVEFEEEWRRAETNLGSFPSAAFEALRSSGVIEPAGGLGRFRFFHQTLLEFAAARFILQAPETIQQACVARVLADLNSGLLIRSPVLVQMAVQDAQAGGQSWKRVLMLLLDSGSETACHLTLEIFGKIFDSDYCLEVLRRWKERYPARLAACAGVAVTHYPKNRLGLGFSVLESTLGAGTLHEAMALCADRLARMDAEETLRFLDRISAMLAGEADYNVRSHYKNALFICFDAGQDAALSTLAAVFDGLTAGLRQSSLASLAERVNERSAPAVAEFLRAIRHIVHGEDANDVIELFLGLLIRLHAVAPQLAEGIASDVVSGSQPERLDDRARLLGGLEGGVLRTPETVPKALGGILSSDHFARRAAAATLAFSDPGDHEAILDYFLSLDLASLDESVRASLFEVAAGMTGAAPEKLISFIGSCPFPEKAGGRAWRKISERLAADAPGQKIRVGLLSGSGSDRSLSRKSAVGISRLLKVQPSLFDDEEVLHIFKLAMASDVDSRRSLVECIGAIASERPDLASGIVAELVQPRHREVWATLAYSMRDCLKSNLQWVISCLPLLVSTAVSRSDQGMFAKLMEALRDWPEEQRGALIDLLEKNFTAEVLAVFSQELCQVEFLMIVGRVARHAPDRAYRLLNRAVVNTSGSAGAAAMAAASIVGHTHDEEILAGALERMLAVAPHARRRNSRNALYRGLRTIDEKLGGRRVISRFFALYAGLQDDDALEVLVRAVARLPSWTSADSAELLRDTRIRGKVRSYVLKMTTG